MYEAYDEAFDEAYDEAYEDAYDEASRNRRKHGGAVKVAPRTSSYKRPAPAGTANAPVTQSQLKAVTDRIGAALKTNGQAISVVDGRVRSLATDHGRLEAAVKRDQTDRKKDLVAVRRDLQSTREITAVLPIITNLAQGTSLAKFAPYASLLLLGNDVSVDPASANNGGFLGLGGAGGSGGMLGLIALVAVASAAK